MRNNWGRLPSIGQVLVVIKTELEPSDPHVGVAGGRWREQLRNLASCQFFVFFVIPMVGKDGGSRGAAGQGTSIAGGNKFLILLNKESQT